LAFPNLSERGKDSFRRNVFFRFCKVCNFGSERARTTCNARSNREDWQFANLYFRWFFFLQNFSFSLFLLCLHVCRVGRLDVSAAARKCTSRVRVRQNRHKDRQTIRQTDRMTDKQKKNTFSYPWSESEICEQTKRTRSIERSLHKTFFFRKTL